MSSEPSSNLPETPPVVAFLIDQLSMGGAEREFVELLRALDAKRILARVGVLRPGGALLAQLPRHPDFLPEGRPGSLRVVRSAQQWLRASGAAVVCTTHTWSALTVGLLHRGRSPHGRTGPAWVATEHSCGSSPASPRLEWLRRRLVRRADRVLAVSQEQARWLQGHLGLDAKRLVVIPNAIDVDAFAAPADPEPVRREFGLPADAPVIVCVGRLSREKGHAVLLAAWSEVPGHLVFVGDGPERGRLEAACRGFGLSDRVHFAGERLDVRPFLAAATAFCLPSLEESQGISLLEAMAAGVPVVASDVGGVPEIVADPSLGRLVPPRDPRALGAALREVLHDAGQRRETTEAARLWVRRRFDLRERARRVEDLLWALARPRADAHE